MTPRSDSASDEYLKDKNLIMHQLKEYAAAIKDVNGKQDTILQILGRIEVQTVKNERNSNSIEERVDKVENKIDEMENENSKNETDIAVIKTKSAFFGGGAGTVGGGIVSVLKELFFSGTAQ